MARIGISGWRYAGWRGQFYPPGLPQRRELAHVAGLLTTVEVNGSFYSLQRPSSWRAWAAEVPEDFVFGVKGPRFITHMKKLVDVEAPLGTFLASGVLSLGDRLGPLLWQLPPNLGFHPDRLTAFFDLLPRTTSAARRSSRSRPTPRRPSTGRCGTCSRCGTRPSARPSSASSCARTGSGWSWPTPLAPGRCSTR